MGIDFTNRPPDTLGILRMFPVWNIEHAVKHEYKDILLSLFFPYAIIQKISLHCQPHIVY